MTIIKLIGYADEEGSLKLLQKAGHSWSCYIQKEPRNRQTAPVYATLSGAHKFRENDLFTTLQLEAALCAWEWMCEARDGDLLKPLFEGIGSSAMRHVSMQAGDIALRVHNHMESQGYEFVNAYDWEFVPEVLRRLDWDKLISDNQYGGEPYEPDIQGIFCAMVTADKASSVDPSNRDFHRTMLMSVDKYTAACWAEADRQWGYGDLVYDHGERVNEARENEEDPVDFIKWLGEKYGLTPASEAVGF
ncbi:hypothetical protein [Rhizobium sp. SSA_523]|uniref:hypothetical protein n=1 Tax=Rhizobium sp. SSA_523 TaxID=2952477 RepID=UPI002090EF9F|nr:hypothetical protein [Rhizobium sp. SSA_523]MCO5730117.1 hypothetical protein [Rhizobium sp. SSA_523]WKC25182.1 hypothetical protein QTJ18_14435 [Rhizobium sp. SSA_523]